jgi:hypothetical protein
LLSSLPALVRGTASPRTRLDRQVAPATLFLPVRTKTLAGAVVARAARALGCWNGLPTDCDRDVSANGSTNV